MLTPLDIESKKFDKKLLGFDTREVRKFLKEIIANYEVLYRENIELKDKINVLNEGIQYYKTIEETLQNTLILAEKAADETKKNARNQAELIEKEAELKAEEILSNTKDELNHLRLQKRNLMRSFETAKIQVQQYLQLQLDMIGKEDITFVEDGFELEYRDTSENKSSESWAKAKEIFTKDED
ncbi:DivIVA domain-containing protein [Clostridiales bacterium COT073_COT-073]|nr:DivIVA domain-containing protein [Clostridiales bacterium COT073_COT-073]